jgi:hypothetical protein
VTAKPIQLYDQTPAHSFVRMLDPKNGLAPATRSGWAARIVESVEVEPAPLRMVFGSRALESTIAPLRKRLAGFEARPNSPRRPGFPAGI